MHARTFKSMVLSILLYCGGPLVSIGVALAERTWHMAWTSAAAAGLNVVLNVALIPPFGLLGASVSTLTAYLVSASLLYRLSQRAYPIPYDLRVPAVVSAAAAVALAVGLALDATASAATWLPGVTAAKAAVFLGVAAVSLRLAQVSVGDLLARIVALRPAGRPTG